MTFVLQTLARMSFYTTFILFKNEPSNSKHAVKPIFDFKTRWNKNEGEVSRSSSSLWPKVPLWHPTTPSPPSCSLPQLGKQSGLLIGCHREGLQSHYHHSIPTTNQRRRSAVRHPPSPISTNRLRHITVLHTERRPRAQVDGTYCGKVRVLLLLAKGHELDLTLWYQVVFSFRYSVVQTVDKDQINAL